MRELSLFIFMLGIIFITVEYMNQKIKTKEETKEKIIYKIVPKSLYDEQLEPTDLRHTFSDLFAKSQPGKSSYATF